MRNDVTEIESSLGVLYASYGIMNRVCWQGRLPPSLLRMSYRLSSRTIAYAADDFRIVFNTRYCRDFDDSGFLQVLAHEMIHIRQYSLGRRGGHGRDFKYEQLRLGLVLGREIPSDSPMGYVFFMHQLKNLHPAEAARTLAAHPNRRKFETEYYQILFQQYNHQPKDKCTCH